MPNIVARAHKLTGDPTAALVLLRLAFRYRQAVQAGRKWTAQSYENLMDETGCSFKQVKRAVALLKELGVVDTKQAMFANKNVAHYRLTAKALMALEGQPKMTPEGQHGMALQGQPKMTPQGQPKMAPKGQLYIQGETTLSDNLEDNLEFVGTSPDKHDDPFPEEISGKGEDIEMIKLKSLADLPGAMEKAYAPVHKPDKDQAVQIAWKKGVSAITGKFIDLTKKEVGQLRLFGKACPPGKAVEIIEFVLKDWVGFAKKTATLSGIKNFPTQPVVGFLLQHRAQAIALWSPPKPAKEQGAPTVPSIPPPVQSPASKPVDAPSTPADKTASEMTWEELWAEPDMSEDV